MRCAVADNRAAAKRSVNGWDQLGGFNGLAV